MSIIEVKHLKKSYGNNEAVKGISFYVEEGTLFAFLGENGAGKSTTINTLAGLISKQSGSICIDGLDMDKHPELIKRRIGMVFQDHYLDNFLTVEENLKTKGYLYKMNKKDIKKRIFELADLLDAHTILKRRYGQLSGGQKRKADIMRALIHNPKILILDEPTTGLDPYTRKKVWALMCHLRQSANLTIFLTTHYMEEAKEADYMVVMDQGSIVAKGKPEDLRMTYTKDFLIIKIKETLDIKAHFTHRPYEYMNSSMIKLPIENSFEALDIIGQYRHIIEYFEVVRGTMDDAFINIIKAGV